ncbi:MAG: UDP-N-acetylmuramoyl-L-alanyl-D-glutamate--2,6-diaminopimelate ligase, partial [Cellulomonas sp.]|nr:UDP-N-acetylmuramoyl-L-alanyl-D-glutamate--2,6-diaminopimelate ligase [Cellulomonas sp.]
MTPKTLQALLDGLAGCQVLGNVDVPVTGVAYHSREVTPGGLFVALKGCRTDGHLYLAASLDQGARVVVTEQELAPPPGVTVVRVPQARLALAHISAAFYDHPSRELTLVGITGTNGKTSTTYILEAILSAAGCRVGVVGTVNYRVGESTWPAPVTTPESLDLQRLLREMRTRDVTHVFLEVSSHALDLRRVDGVVFAAAVFTNLSQDHLDYHRDLNEYFAAKSRLFLEILANGRPSRGLAVLNLDDPRGRELKDAVGDPALTYGLHPDSQVRPLSYRFRQDGLEARLTTPAGEVEITSRLVGPFNLANILAAAATALGLGIDPDTVARGIAALPGVPGRLERFGPPAGPGVFVDYAHTPVAITQALAA